METDYEMVISIRGLSYEDAQFGYQSLTNPPGEREPLHGSAGMSWSGGFWNGAMARIIFGRQFDKIDGSVTICPVHMPESSFRKIWKWLRRENNGTD